MSSISREAQSARAERAARTDPPVLVDAEPSVWVRARQEALWSWVRGLGVPHEIAEDIVQDTFVAALAQRERCSWSDDHAQRWLRATARNLWRAHLRRESRRAGRESEWLTRAAGADEVSMQALLSALRACQEQLTPRSRLALRLRYREGVGRREMGEILQIEPEGVKSFLQRIRQVLRVCIERQGAL